MIKRWRLWLLLLFGLVLSFLPAATNQRASTMAPTIFVHGYRGSAESLGELMQSASNAGLASHTLTVTVRPDGELVFSQEMTSDLPAMIQVVFQNNIAGERAYTRWLHKIYAALYQRYGYRQLNAVGHSMGAYAVVAAAMLNSPIKTNKMLAIAGPYNGILHWDDEVHEVSLNKQQKPDVMRPEYKWLLAHAKNFKANSVLNLYGDVEDGSDSDTVVAANSALSLGYVLRNSHATYRTERVLGPHAQHSLLHIHNRQVTDIMLHYLFGWKGWQHK
ncbi:alpha/beta hydrolase [Lacticaseibacillus saniviri]